MHPDLIFPLHKPRTQHQQAKPCMPWVSGPEPGPRSRQAFKINKPLVSCLRSRLNSMFPLSRKGQKPQNPATQAWSFSNLLPPSLPSALSFPLSGLCLSTWLSNKSHSACSNLHLHSAELVSSSRQHPVPAGFSLPAALEISEPQVSQRLARMRCGISALTLPLALWLKAAGCLMRPSESY